MDAYKQLPLDPEYIDLTIIASRCPSSGKWMGFDPRVLLFGAVSAVIHYNCFTREFDVIINRAFGIPLLSYYDDFGSIAPEILGQTSLETIHSDDKAITMILRDGKSEVGRRVKFLGLLGPFSHP